MRNIKENEIPPLAKQVRTMEHNGATVTAWETAEDYNVWSRWQNVNHAHPAGTYRVQTPFGIVDMHPQVFNFLFPEPPAPQHLNNSATQ